MENDCRNFNVPQEELLDEYYKLCKMFDEYSARIRAIVFEPQNSLPYMNLGRLVKVKYNGMEYEWGMIVRYEEIRVRRANFKSKLIIINESRIKINLLFIFIFISSHYIGRNNRKKIKHIRLEFY